MHIYKFFCVFLCVYQKKVVPLQRKNNVNILMASTRQEIIEELKQLLLTQDVAEIKDQVDHLKTQFYSI